MESLEGYWHLVSGFFHDGQHLLQFPEVFEHRYASLRNRVYNATFSNVSFFH
jgi:hypothetical protein